MESRNNISFKSNIKFVPIELERLNLRGKEIGFLPGEQNCIKASEFVTYGIKTCTGGGLVIPGQEALGFHYLDASFSKFFKINKFIKDLGSQIQPERGLLVGGKRAALFGYIFSIRNFKTFKKGLEKLTKNLSIFECHKYPFSQTGFHYSLENDTWTLCHSFINEKGAIDYVKNLDDLKKCYKKIQIADGDRLFIGGEEIKL